MSSIQYKTPRLRSKDNFVRFRQNDLQEPWNELEKFLFRSVFVFFFLITIPLDPDYYSLWFTTDWANLHIRDIGSLTGRGFQFARIDSESGNFGLLSYINWFIAFGIGIVVAIVWAFVDRKPRNYSKPYYFASVAVSFSMLCKLQGLTFSKVFPTQMPELALTQLNTPYGDLTAQKLYWLQFSFVHGYEIFAGLAELLIMILLFFRQTRAWGAALALAMVGNIALANHLYDGGVHVLAMLYAIGGLFVLWPYISKLWKLLVKEQDVSSGVYYYKTDASWYKWLKFGLKTFVFLFFFVISAYAHWQNYKYDSYKVPSRPGLANARGLYDATEFKFNGQIIPYSPVDSVRWQEVTFEKWSTLSFTVFKKIQIHNEAGRGKQFADIDRTYESAGTGGGRRHYYYEADTVNKKMVLRSKNKLYPNERFELHYKRPSENRIVLRGVNERKDSLYIVLDRRPTVYPLYEGRKASLALTP